MVGIDTALVVIYANVAYLAKACLNTTRAPIQGIIPKKMISGIQNLCLFRELHRLDLPSRTIEKAVKIMKKTIAIPLTTATALMSLLISCKRSLFYNHTTSKPSCDVGIQVFVNLSNDNTSAKDTILPSTPYLRFGG